MYMTYCVLNCYHDVIFFASNVRSWACYVDLYDYDYDDSFMIVLCMPMLPFFVMIIISTFGFMTCYVYVFIMPYVKAYQVADYTRFIMYCASSTTCATSRPTSTIMFVLTCCLLACTRPTASSTAILRDVVFFASNV